MMTEHRLTGLTAFAVFATVIFFALPTQVHAQRVSVQDMQAQIDALTFPYDEPAAQVATALELLPTFQEAVARYYREKGETPVDRQYAGLSANPTDTQTSFIAAVDIINGTVVFTFGNDADPSIAALQLAFIPYESDDATIVWRCGNASAPANTALLGTSTGGNQASFESTTIPFNLEPSPCILQSQSGSSDEIIRAQVLEPFEVVAAIQDAVEAAGIALGAPGQPQAPTDRSETGLTPDDTDTQGRYFESVDIINGTIEVRYGNEVHPLLDGNEMYWTPYETNDGTIVWRCGYADYLAGTYPMGTAYGGNTAAYWTPSVPERYLPFDCLY